jgi:dUTP pyrophosphatase
MTRMVYLARPIDQVRGGHELIAVVNKWLDEELAKNDLVVFRPAEAFRVEGSLSAHPGVEVVNRWALAQADVLVALVPAGVPTIGTPREIEAAAALGIPVAVVTNIDRPYSLADCDLIVPMTTSGVAEAAVWASLQPSRASSAASDFAVASKPGSPAQIVFAPVDGASYETTQFPRRTYTGDAGYDLFVSERTAIPVGEFRDVPTGVRVAVPDGVWVRITGRSSTLRNRGLLVAEGIIDTGWRGPLFTGVQNIGRQTVILEVGERVAQLIPHPNLAAVLAPVSVSGADFDDIPNSDGRGTSGFGSTGR